MQFNFDYDDSNSVYTLLSMDFLMVCLPLVDVVQHSIWQPEKCLLLTNWVDPLSFTNLFSFTKCKCVCLCVHLPNYSSMFLLLSHIQFLLTLRMSDIN